MYLRVILACLLAGGLSNGTLAQAQPTPTQPPPAATPAGPGQQVLTNAQLDALVAPIALYPDTLLSQILMASTYPLEVVQADRWVSANKQLKGDQLKTEAEKQAWDASVKSLVATPSVLEMMSKNLDWTQRLGDAVLAQQPDVMDGIQRMRTRAYDNKKLSSGSQQTVTVRQESGRQMIAIEPAVADTVYVPYYDPGVVYGAWPYPDTQPYYFPYTGYVAAGVVATGLAFGAGYALGRWTNGNYWGGNINWNNNNINIDRDRVTHWQHNPQHRHGVQYRNNAVQQRFGNNNIRAGSEGRMDFRGRSGDQVLQPRGDGGLGDRAGQRPGDRAGVGDRGPGDRAGAGSRPGDRAGAADRARAGGAPRAAQQNRAAQNRAAQNRAAQNRAAQNRPRPSANRAAPRRDGAFGNVQPGRAASLQSQRGQASFAHARPGGGPRMGGGGYGGGPRMGGGGGGARMGGGGFGGGRGGGGRGGGGRRSDMLLKDHVVLLGRLGSGLGFYRFEYTGSDTTYVGVIAQEVQGVAPQAVSRGADGYLRVNYELLGLRFQTFQQWQASGARIPTGDIRH